MPKPNLDSLISQMTLDEKLAQIGSCWIHELQNGNDLDPALMSARLKDGIGQITRIGGDSVLTPAAVARTANTIQKHLIEQTRLGIPAIVHEECCAGSMILGGDNFPQMLGLAATFQPELAEAMTTVIRKQLRAVGAHQGLAPVLDVARDPRWGRCEETFGEDPILVSHFGAAYIRGLQSADLAQGIMATGKHFIGHSLSQGGMNCAPVHMGIRDLYDIYLPPFQAAIRDAGLASMMNSYPELDGEVVATSRRILTELLRDKLGFDGVVVSDYEAVMMIHNYHRAAATPQIAARLALEAGIDVELPTTSYYGAPLRAALAAGELSIETVDLAVRRHLQKKIELGLFENPYVDEGRIPELFSRDEIRSLTQTLARQSMVLLKNDGLLPLPKTIGTLAVIGPNADNGRNQLGDYSYASTLELTCFNAKTGMQAAGAHFAELDPTTLDPYAPTVTTVLDGIRALVSPETKLLYTDGLDEAAGFETSLTAAMQADAVVLVLGDKCGLTMDCTCGETRDTSSLRLPLIQEKLAGAILALDKPVAVVLITGRPQAISFLDQKANAILEAWIPGEEGGAAVAETLFGDNNPGGKLPMTFPRSVGQLPIFYNAKPSGIKSNWYINYVNEPVTPLYPFGHGLSYTTFAFDGLKLDKAQATVGETLDIQCTVKNTGAVAGTEVVQLYICDEYAALPRPVKELKGYLRLYLNPGESKTVTFHLPVDMLAYYDDTQNLILEPGTIKVMIGSSSADIHLQSSFEIVGPGNLPVAQRLFVCPVEVD